MKQLTARLTTRLAARLAIGTSLAAAAILAATALGPVAAQASDPLHAYPDCEPTSGLQLTCTADIDGGTAPYGIAWYKNGTHLPLLDNHPSFDDWCLPVTPPTPNFRKYKLVVTDATGATATGTITYFCVTAQ